MFCSSMTLTFYYQATTLLIEFMCVYCLFLKGSSPVTLFIEFKCVHLLLFGGAFVSSIANGEKGWTLKFRPQSALEVWKKKKKKRICKRYFYKANKASKKTSQGSQYRCGRLRNPHPHPNPHFHIPKLTQKVFKTLVFTLFDAITTGQRTDQRTDQRTNQRTDKASFRVACPQLKD